ncbi:MAG: hypothetical protein ACREL7_18380 [Longimicrobiales bacterium]
MRRPSIAIVGSADPDRPYDPPLKNQDTVLAAAADLGRALAEAGFGLIVYSANPDFIESCVVRGYIESGVAEPKSICVRYPLGAQGTDLKFHLEDEQNDLFDRQPDQHQYWQISFYRSLLDADGIIVLGGAESAFLTGVVALMNEIPCVALATFGGSAESVWRSALGSMATDEHRRIMSQPRWNATHAPIIVRVLREQREAIEARKRSQSDVRRRGARTQRRRGLAAAVATILAVGLTGIGWFWPSPPLWLFAMAFLATPLVAGICGGLARLIFNEYHGDTPRPNQTTGQAMVLGMIAGLVAAILFVLAQLASNPNASNLSSGIPPELGRLIAFELIVGLIAGFTLEAVFDKIKRTDALKAKFP